MLILGSDGKLSDKLNVLRIKQLFIIYFSMYIFLYINIMPVYLQIIKKSSFGMFFPRLDDLDPESHLPDVGPGASEPQPCSHSTCKVSQAGRRTTEPVGVPWVLNDVVNQSISEL